MSLILDALRKSEAERRRGQVPDLHSELPPSARVAALPRAARPWLMAVAIFAAVAVLAMFWLAREPRAPTPIAANGAASRGELVEDSAAGRVSTATLPSEPAPDQAKLNPRPVRGHLPSRVAPRGEPIEPVRIQEATARPHKPGPATRVVGGAGDQPIMVADTSPPAATTPAPLPVAPSGPVPVPTPTPAMAPVPQANGIAAAPTTAAADKPTQVQLADLRAAERRALPALDISMHMWAPKPADRFAIIDGERFNEGDRIGQAVVAEITRDGVVLAWHGRRVEVPIR